MRVSDGCDSESEGSDGSVAYFHRVSSDSVPANLIQPKKPKMKASEVREIARKSFEAKAAGKARERLSEELGVSVDSLIRMRVGLSFDEWNGKEWTSWPSKNAKGEYVGITRRYWDGEKKTYPGCTNGLFYPTNRKGLRGCILIAEGGSDVAAATSIGLLSIGRPSNVGGAAEIKRLIKNRRAIVIGEMDEKPHKRGAIDACKEDCKGCNHCFPGLHGAKVVSERLGVPYVMPPEGAKDLRDAINKGLLWPELLRSL